VVTAQTLLLAHPLQLAPCQPPFATPQLSSRLHVTTYPCVALLAYPGARTKVVACLQGRFTAAQLLAALRRAVDEHGALLAAERLQQEERVRWGAGRWASTQGRSAKRACWSSGIQPGGPCCG
jgi:hypothetical protein